MNCHMLAAAVALTTVATTLQAQTAPKACLADQRDFDFFMGALQSEGWTALMPGEEVPEPAPLASLTTDDTTRAIIETVSVLPPLEE